MIALLMNRDACCWACLAPCRSNVGLLRRLVGGTTVSRAPEVCVGPGRPNGVGLVSLIHKLVGLTLL